MRSRGSKLRSTGQGALIRSAALLFLVAAMTMGCATTAGFRRNMNTWVGADVNRLMTQWGPPSNEFRMPNGNTQYSWLYTGSTLVNVHYNEYLNMITAGSVTYWCHITVTANTSSTIVAWNARGNSCRSR